jgi:hypothetical protein
MESFLSLSLHTHSTKEVERKGKGKSVVDEKRLEGGLIFFFIVFVPAPHTESHGFSTLVSNSPMTLPGGSYWHTYSGEPEHAAFPHPTRAVPTHTI